MMKTEQAQLQDFDVKIMQKGFSGKNKQLFNCYFFLFYQGNWDLK